MEDFAVDVFGLQDVGGDVVGFIFDLGFAQNLVGVQVGHHQIQLGIHVFKGFFGFQHLGGGGVNGDFLVTVRRFLLGHFVELFVGHVAPLVIVGAVVVGIGFHIVADGQGAGGIAGRLGVAGGLRITGGLGVPLGVAALVVAAGGQAEDHDQGHQQRKEFLLHQIFSFRFGEIVMLEYV